MKGIEDKELQLCSIKYIAEWKIFRKKCFLPNIHVLNIDQLHGCFVGSEREVKYIGKILDGFSLASKSSTPSKVSRYWYFRIKNNISKLTCELYGLYCCSMFFMFLEINVLVSNKRLLNEQNCSVGSYSIQTSNLSDYWMNLNFAYIQALSKCLPYCPLLLGIKLD